MTKTWRIILGCIEVFVAISAIPAAISLLADPSGAGVGLPQSLLVDTPFNNFTIPAIILLVVIGLGNVLGAYHSFSKNSLGGVVGMLLGFILMIWIGVQVYFIGYSFSLQTLFLIVGIVQLTMGYFYSKALKTE